ncbi:hypothetical protein QFC21_005177 [Naganishia friedmannii]|uniref:Uncharacterized protein n=1 Tax=Naganishia friedmannii TaxID=89922 RepID=A0ACC2VCL0_9TREE|nr:hypothetical protein QFC21_005177 [Naganishia friedmannii]
MATAEAATIGELNMAEINDAGSAPQVRQRRSIDDVRAFMIQTLANLPQERVASTKLFQEEKEEERLIEARNIPGGPRLPYELIANVARHLQDQISVKGFYFALRTLAKLNRMSQAVHEVTLPHLPQLRKVRPHEEFAFWLLEVYQTAEDDEWQEVDLKKMFPRIELLSVWKQVNGSEFKERKDSGATLYEQDLQVTLFKTVTIDDLQSLCLQFTGNAKKGTVCMGKDYE